MSHASAFKTPEGEAAFLAAYAAAMKRWPVPYEELEIPSRFGMTHVIVSGPKEAPPLVLLNGSMATSTMSAPNIADFSKDYRVYAIDVMGQPSKSILFTHAIEPAGFLMTRRMLLGIKQRAEALRAGRTETHGDRGAA